MAATGRAGPWATIAGFAAILLWSLTVAISRSLSEKLGPLPAGAMIFTGSGLLLLAMQRLRRRPPPAATAAAPAGRLRYLLVCGGLFLLYDLAFYLAIGLARDRAQAIELALLNYLWPSLTILFSILLLGARARWWVGPGVLLAFAGVALVLLPAGAGGAAGAWASFLFHVRENPVAYAAGLAAGVTWPLFSVLNRRWAPSGGQGAIALFLLASGLSLALLSPALGFGWRPVGLRSALELGVMILSCAAANTLWDVAMRKGRVTRVAAASNFTPLLSTLVSCAYLGVAPEPGVWAGAVLIASGSLLCWVSLKHA